MSTSLRPLYVAPDGRLVEATAAQDALPRLTLPELVQRVRDGDAGTAQDPSAAQPVVTWRAAFAATAISLLPRFAGRIVREEPTLAGGFVILVAEPWATRMLAAHPDVLTTDDVEPVTGDATLDTP